MAVGFELNPTGDQCPRAYGSGVVRGRMPSTQAEDLIPNTTGKNQAGQHQQRQDPAKPRCSVVQISGLQGLPTKRYSPHPVFVIVLLLGIHDCTPWTGKWGNPLHAKELPAAVAVLQIGCHKPLTDVEIRAGEFLRCFPRVFCRFQRVAAATAWANCPILGHSSSVCCALSRRGCRESSIPKESILLRSVVREIPSNWLAATWFPST